MGRAVLDVPPGYRAGGWQVAGHIASGSWGSVYAAHRAQAPRTDADPPEGTEAALKLIPRGTLSWPQYAQLEETVREEVRFNDQADHPLLVHTFETFVVDDRATPTLHGAVVVAMERAERNLAEAIGDLQPDEAERIAAQMCAALTYIHGLGWVHGDLKPQNVLLMHDGSVRLADFGLTRELEGTHAYAPRMGSSDFLPPEWWSERIAEHGVRTRPTADIWALGVTIHQLLTGGLFPFAGAGPRAPGGSAGLRRRRRSPAPRRRAPACLAPDRRRLFGARSRGPAASHRRVAAGARRSAWHRRARYRKPLCIVAASARARRRSPRRLRRRRGGRHGARR
jgi:serine/threonine protein kinase